VRLHAKKPVSKAYPNELVTVGDHIRKRRLDLKLTQKEVGTVLGVDESTVWNWESSKAEPLTKHLPAIICFLGYSPFNGTGQSLGERLRDYRRKTGLTQKKLAREIGIDPSTLSRLEENCSRCFKKVVKKSTDFLHRTHSGRDV
jgi:transcriptional regulator with XRE-family HTH domain